MVFDGKSQVLDAQVRAARDRGAFDNLPGHGKELPPDELSGLSPEQRFDALLLRSCGEVLPEATLLREIREGRKQLLSCKSPEAREALRAVLRAKALEVSQMWRRPK
jgi:hypothetical protein